jgi:excisionase family DNA binding protein
VVEKSSGPPNNSGSGSDGDDASALTLHEAADELGVHYMTMYRYVRLGLVPAAKSGGSWLVARTDLEAFVAPSQQATKRGEAPWSERLESRMVAGDLGGGGSVVEACLASGAEPEGVYADVLAPALASIGEKWANGELGIDEEHLASAVAARIIGRMSSRFMRRGRTRGTVITAMPSGERHGLGLAMMADVVRGAGYSVLDLGPDTPASSLVTAMERSTDLVAVCLSAVYSDVLPRLQEMIEAVRDAGAGRVAIIVGGHAIDDGDHAVALGADAYAQSINDVAELLSSVSPSSASA